MSTGIVCARALSLALVLSAAGAAPIAAQGSVSGQIRVLERSGDPTTDLENAVVYFEPLAQERPRVKGTTTRIAMQGRRFAPRVRVVPVGSKVEFPNEDPFSHNIFSNAAGATFDLGLYGRGKSKSASYRRAGAFPVFCNIHPRMTAFVVAVPTTYYTQPDANGRFSIDRIPAGRYSVHFWHERTPAQRRLVEIGANGMRGLDAALDGRGYTFVPHKNKFGQEYTGSGRDRY